MSSVHYRTMPKPVKRAVLVLRKDVPDGHLCAPTYGNRHCFLQNAPKDDSLCDCGAYRWNNQVAQDDAVEMPLF